ncbi:PASTA domain-containing protein [Paractinoplanes brasiliensis]|uniref:PASTA domain-containing protein n=2 Tax=Paractinoplanes brasiliensis TaxID=52695 RepID=A0A4R6J8Y5_9ACTN|nr:PASTA domain-containing protein [Actinoplanes brasiliensis]GID28131.1 hypothetical protein Abr02nite_31140 [Actinoplanes brasiliensis]
MWAVDSTPGEKWKTMAEKAPRRAGSKIQAVVVGSVVFLALGIIGVGVLAGFASEDEQTRRGLFVTATVLIVFAAAMAVGAFLGFLFGMPRSRLADLAPSPDQGKAALSTRYLTNSNFVKVSDWFTTIIVGLGIANLNSLVPGVRRLGNALVEPMGGSQFGAAIGISVVLVGVISGFVLSYLWTTIRVRELLEESEAALTTVPDLNGKSPAEAIELASAKSITLVLRPMNGERISSQNITPGTTVRRGQAVAVE